MNRRSGVYKGIRQVMAAQGDLVEIVAQFDPGSVKMCGDDSAPEDWSFLLL